MNHPEQMRDSGWREAKPYPSYTRYHWGCFALGMAVGITWTISMTNPLVERYLHLSRYRAIGLLYAAAAVLMVQQAWMLYRWNKRLNADREALRKNVVILKQKYPEQPWDDLTKL